MEFDDMSTEELLNLLKSQLEEKNKIENKIRKYLVQANEELIDLIDAVDEIGSRLFLLEGMDLELKDMRDSAKKLYNVLEFLFPEGRD